MVTSGMRFYGNAISSKLGKTSSLYIKAGHRPWTCRLGRSSSHLPVILWERFHFALKSAKGSSADIVFD